MARVVERANGATVVYSGIPLPDFPRAARDAAQAAMIRVVEMWRRRIGPVHFMNKAYSMYAGIDPRVYPRRKGGRGGRALKSQKGPLFRSGRLRRAFLTGSMQVRAVGSRAGALRVRGTWRGLPPYAHMRNEAPYPAKHLELTVTNAADERVMGQWFAKAFQEELEKASGGVN